MGRRRIAKIRRAIDHLSGAIAALCDLVFQKTPNVEVERAAA
jgi:hypothetical protein